MVQGLGNLTVSYEITATFVPGKEIPGRVTQISISPPSSVLQNPLFSRYLGIVIHLFVYIYVPSR